jgi:hypothetical protein
MRKAKPLTKNGQENTDSSAPILDEKESPNIGSKAMPTEVIKIDVITLPSSDGLFKNEIRLTPQQTEILVQVALSVLTEMGLIVYIKRAQEKYTEWLNELNPEDMPQA